MSDRLTYGLRQPQSQRRRPSDPVMLCYVPSDGGTLPNSGRSKDVQFPAFLTRVSCHVTWKPGQRKHKQADSVSGQQREDFTE